MGWRSHITGLYKCLVPGCAKHEWNIRVRTLALAMCDNIREQAGIQADRQTDIHSDIQTDRRQTDRHGMHAGVELSGVSCHTAPRDLVRF